MYFGSSLRKFGVHVRKSKGLRYAFWRTVVDIFIFGRKATQEMTTDLFIVHTNRTLCNVFMCIERLLVNFASPVLLNEICFIAYGQ